MNDSHIKAKHNNSLIQRCQTPRRSIDCTQECSICWETFKVKEQVCWSKNVTCR
jgi:hypothetical protein